MKKLLISFLSTTALLIIVLSFGCTKNLEEKPVSIISGVNYYNNDAEFTAAINGAFYPMFSGWGFHDFNGIFLLTSGGEDVTSRATAPELRQWDNFKPTLNGPHASNAWNNCYASINACNQIIEKAPKSTAVSAANKLSYEAQARFLRAISYFYLTRFWGEVPIMTTENYLDAASVSQSTVADVYKVIVEDLIFAEANLPLKQADGARPTKGAAKAILARVYLTMAGWPTKDATKYALARDKAKEVMDLNIYDLEPNFADLWLTKNKFTTKEFIFIFNGSAAVSATSSHMHEAQRPGEEGGWTDVCTEVRFINAFPAGPRKDASFWTVFADAKRTPWQQSMEGQPYIAKYRDAGTGATREQGVVNSYNGDGFFPVIRYADVLLMYAEAANKAEGSPSVLALECVNRVRRRAGGNDPAVYPDLPTGMSQNDFDAAVLAERNWELAFEGNRWFDLVRREMVESANAALYPGLDKHNYWHPKPGTEVSLMPGLKQNQGYN